MKKLNAQQVRILKECLNRYEINGVLPCLCPHRDGLSKDSGFEQSFIKYNNDVLDLVNRGIFEFKGDDRNQYATPINKNEVSKALSQWPHHNNVNKRGLKASLNYPHYQA